MSHESRERAAKDFQRTSQKPAVQRGKGDKIDVLAEVEYIERSINGACKRLARLSALSLSSVWAHQPTIQRRNLRRNFNSSGDDVRLITYKIMSIMNILTLISRNNTVATQDSL
jgi:hypothetical protein